MMVETHDTTAMAVAFATAGYATPRQRVDRLVRSAVERHPANPAVAVVELSRALLDADAAVVWEFFRDDRSARLWREVEEMLRQIRREQGLDPPRPAAATEKEDDPSGHRAPASSAAGSGHLDDAQSGHEARAAPAPRPAATLIQIARDSLLWTFKVAEMPIGQCSAGVVRSWARARGREARFAFLLCEGLTDEMIIGEKKTDADAREAERLARESVNG